jgi:hypothetical protein
MIMNSWLLFYLIGVVLGISLLIIANRNINIKTWKLKPILKTFLFTLGSWVFIYAVAIKGILND